MGNGEAKELMCVTHLHELRRWIAGGDGDTSGGRPGGKNCDNRNSIINKIYLKTKLLVNILKSYSIFLLLIIVFVIYF